MACRERPGNFSQLPLPLVPPPSAFVTYAFDQAGSKFPGALFFLLSISEKECWSPGQLQICQLQICCISFIVMLQDACDSLLLDIMNL
jgi:hypothetical protein